MYSYLLRLCILIIMYVLFCVFRFIVLFVCKCLLYYCHRMSTQYQLNNIYHIIHDFLSLEKSFGCVSNHPLLTLSISRGRKRTGRVI